MPSQPLPFVNDLQSGLQELAGATAQAVNVVVDQSGTVRRRPGIVPFFEADQNDQLGSQGASALHVTDAGKVYALVPPTAGSLVNNVFRVSPGGAISSGAIVGTSRPVVLETEMLLVIAAGRDIYKLELSGIHSAERLGGDPPLASHVAFNNRRLIANDVLVDRSAVRYSSQASGTTSYAGFERWTPFVQYSTGAAGFQFAAAETDPIVAVGATVNETWLFGARTLQLFAPDATYTYLPSSTMEVGCVAPHSIVKREGEFYWLDHARRFVKSSGRGTEVLSQGIHAVLQGLSRVDDCYGYRVLAGPVDGIAWTFPEAGLTFFMQVGAGWATWGSWDNMDGLFRPFVVTSHTYNRLTGQNLVGVPYANVGVLQLGVASDTRSDSHDSEDSEPIVASITTGFLNRGTDARKVCRGVRLTFRRDGGTRVPQVRGTLEWRDAPGAWEPPLPVVLDGAQPVCELRSLGTYRRRQWRYTFSDSAEDLVFAGAEEDFEVTD